MNSYRKGFIAALAVNILLGAALVWVWWRGHSAPRVAKTNAAEQGEAPSAKNSGQSSLAEMAPTETPLVPVQLSPERQQSIGVKTGTVEYQAISNDIRAVGNVAVDERGLAYVQTRFSGWIQKVYADATYQYIRKGQPLFTIYSPDLVSTEQEYLLARKNRDLLAASTIPGVASGSDSLVYGAKERLREWEIPEREIQRLASTGQPRRELEIDSPVSGYIIERNALPNLYAQPDTKLYTVADLSTVWVFAQIFQPDIGKIRAGAPATVTSDAYPGREFHGSVDFIYPEVDVSTRTVKVRLVFPNPSLKLTPGMFVNVDLKIPLGRQLSIPAGAVFQTGTRSIVFVNRGEGYLEPRAVTLGPRAGDQYIVLEGLKQGEKIVTSANFLIDSESQLQASLGSFAPPPPGAGAAAAMNAPAKAATIEFTTQPSPPHKGGNIFRVTLKDGSGAPISGAQVTVTFFMPAMPAMGMAAMRSVFTLADKGGGLYEGQGVIESGGTWQVTIMARKNGQNLAQQQLSVNAEGGM